MAEKVLELLDGTMLHEYFDEVYAEYLRLLEKRIIFYGGRKRPPLMRFNYFVYAILMDCCNPDEK